MEKHNKINSKLIEYYSLYNSSLGLLSVAFKYFYPDYFKSKKSINRRDAVV